MGLIIKAKLTNRHPDDTLAGSLESKKPVDWLRILLILVTFESVQCDIKIYIKRLLCLLLDESPNQSYVAALSYYQRQLVNKRMYPSVWSQNCLFLLIEKATAMVCFSSLRLTREDSILHHKAVKVTINALDFAEVIINVIVCL